MKINIKTKDVIITAKQKSMIEKKMMKMKKYLSQFEPVNIDIILLDQTGTEKGGIDQMVSINVTYGKEKIYVEEVDDHALKAFSYAYDRLERNLKREHQKNVDKSQKVGDERIEKVFGFLKRNKRNKK